ncbi:2-pyrone-4,6-dicarbaxylate hydrolase [Firmicutes bacterium ASF500]|nr:2-pyrone-4,6-dicarbaxylate hydrolase [Firmicutes bacterium ASF500]
MSAPRPFSMPPNACNAHLHIIDPAYPNDGKAAAQVGTVETYRKLAGALKLPRAVFVQAKPFALDNSCLLDAIQAFGPENVRGIAVVGPDTTDQELESLHTGGVRGLRFSVWNQQNAVVSFEDCIPLSRRCAQLGWNIQLHMSAAQLAERFDTIRKLGCRVVIDHMGRLKPRLGTHDPAYPLLLRLIDQGSTWVKLSGPYLNTSQGKPWHDASSLAAELARFAPERVLWGSDFPHVTEQDKPSEMELAGLIPLWFPTQRAQELALVENPAQLYGF